MGEKAGSTATSPGALLGWGMTLLAVGALTVFSALSRRAEGDPPGFTVVGGIVLLVGWGLLTVGLVRLAQRVDTVSRHAAAPPGVGSDSPKTTPH